MLFIGLSYESLFDRLEIFIALVFAHENYTEDGHVWGPAGRFAWKYRSGLRASNPFTELVAEAERETDNWAPLKAGLFDGSYERFTIIATRYQTELLDKLNWI